MGADLYSTPTRTVPFWFVREQYSSQKAHHNIHIGDHLRVRVVDVRSRIGDWCVANGGSVFVVRLLREVSQ